MAKKTILTKYYYFSSKKRSDPKTSNNYYWLLSNKRLNTNAISRIPYMLHTIKYVIDF